MAKAPRDFTDILVRNGTLSADQLEEAHRLATSTRIKVHEAIAKLNYANADELMKAMAEHHGLSFINLTETQIPQSVVEMVPESVARENRVMPVSAEGNVLRI